MVDIPKDVQVATARYRKPGPKVGGVQHRSYRPALKADPKLIEQAVDMLAAAERPILYTGGGIINAGPGRVATAARVAADFRRARYLDADGTRLFPRQP